MDSDNDSFMASSKVGLLQHHSRQPSSSRNPQKTYKSLIIIISFSFIILVSLIVSSMILFHLHNHNYNLTSEPTESHRPNSANLKTFCSVTQDPELCFNSISSFIKGTETDPDDIFAVSIKVAIDNITSVVPLMREVLLGSSMTGAESALKYCTESVSDSLSQLNKSLTAVLLRAEENSRVFSSDVPVDLGMEPSTADRRGDVMTWLTRAMSGLDTCVDILDGVGSVAVDELSVKVYKARVQANNSREFLLFKEKILEHFVIRPAGNTDKRLRVNFGYLSTLFILCPQYLVLIFLFCLLLRVR